MRNIRALALPQRFSLTALAITHNIIIFFGIRELASLGSSLQPVHPLDNFSPYNEVPVIVLVCQCTR